MVYARDPAITLLDKLYFLWTICVIAHLKETNQKVTMFNVKDQFGQKALDIYRYYIEIAMSQKYVAPNGYTLTPKGNRAATNWRHIKDHLIDI